MNVLSQFWQVREGFDQISAKSNRMRRGESQSLEPFNFMDRFEQLPEGKFFVCLGEFVAAIKISDLPKQRDFFHAACDQIANFAHDFRNRAAALRAARL